MDGRSKVAPVVTVRWRTSSPNSVDERLIMDADGHARLEVLRPRSLGDTVGTYEGAVDEADFQALSAAGPEVELDVVGQDPRMTVVAAAADRAAQRLLASPLAVAQFFARPVGAVPPLPTTLAIGILGGGREPVEFELDLAACAIHFSSGGSQPSSTPLPELSTGFMTADTEGLGGVRQRAIVPPGVVGAISVPLVVPDGADQVSARVVGSWFLPGESKPQEFEAHTAPQKL
jgi:hypothetical protein